MSSGTLVSLQSSSSHTACKEDKRPWLLTEALVNFLIFRCGLRLALVRLGLGLCLLYWARPQLQAPGLEREGRDLKGDQTKTNTAEPQKRVK